jgi:hypothetical protein
MLALLVIFVVLVVACAQLNCLVERWREEEDSTSRR